MKLKRPKLSDILFFVLVVLFIVPQTRKPIQVFVNRIFSFSPSVISDDERVSLSDYNWKLQNLEGEEFDFRSVRGKVVLLNFWATWCPPCIAEMPAIQELYDDYGDRVVFLLVSNEKNTVIEGFTRKKGYRLPIYKSLTAYPEPLAGNSLPTTYLIDKKGKIIIHKTGAADWNSDTVRSTIDGLLAE